MHSIWFVSSRTLQSSREDSTWTLIIILESKIEGDEFPESGKVWWEFRRGRIQLWLGVAQRRN